MTPAVIGSPSPDASSQVLTDWLELTAFFDNFGRATLDQIEGILLLQEEEHSSDIGEADAEREQIRLDIEREISQRQQSLGRLYPFELSDDGEVVTVKKREGREAASLYLFCLIISHATQSEILLSPPIGGMLRIARNEFFQAIATMAVSGYIQGPALWLGWPRLTNESIIDVVSRACEHSGTGQARQVAAATASEYDKDHGIDVLGWQPANDRPPPLRFVFGQTASGHNWAGKSAQQDAESLRRNYFLDQPACQYDNITLVPHRLDDWILMSNHHRHGTILDRTRIPLYASRGLSQFNGGAIVDGITVAKRLWRWLSIYKKQPQRENYS